MNISSILDILRTAELSLQVSIYSKVSPQYVAKHTQIGLGDDSGKLPVSSNRYNTCIAGCPFGHMHNSKKQQHPI